MAGGRAHRGKEDNLVYPCSELALRYLPLG